MKAKILLAEDDTSLGYVIADQLRTEGYHVTLCANGIDAYQKFNEDKFNICVLDVMMPKKDGFTLATEIRKLNSEIPIMFLTAKTMMEDKSKGFALGGDDYLTKPFSFEELHIRIKALLKRVNIVVDEMERKEIKLGMYTFDVENYRLVHPNYEKTLTRKEAQILKMLCKFKNQVAPREVILNAVWGQDDYFVGRSLDVFITKLRRYLADDPTVQITNIHGIGFKLVCE